MANTTGVVNLNDTIHALETNARALSSIADICNIIKSLQITKKDIAKMKNVASLLEEIASDGIQSIIIAINNLSNIRFGDLKKTDNFIKHLQGVSTRLDTIFGFISNITKTIMRIINFLDPEKNAVLAMGPIKLWLARRKIRKVFKIFQNILMTILTEMDDINQYFDKIMRIAKTTLLRGIPTIFFIVYILDILITAIVIAMMELENVLKKANCLAVMENIKMIIQSLFDIANIFSETNSNLLTFARGVIIAFFQLKLIVFLIEEILRDRTVQMYTKYLKILKKIQDTVVALLDLINFILEFGPKTLKFLLIFKNITGAVSKLKDLLDKLDNELLEGQTVQKHIQYVEILQKIKDTLTEFFKITDIFVTHLTNLRKSTAIITFATFSVKSLKTFFNALDDFLNEIKIEQLGENKEKINEINDYIITIHDLFKELKALSITILWSASLILMATGAGVVCMLGIFLLIQELNLIFELLKQLNVDNQQLIQITKNIGQISLIFLLLIALSTIIIILGTMMVPVILSSLLVVYGVVILIGVTFIITAILAALGPELTAMMAPAIQGLGVLLGVLALTAILIVVFIVTAVLLLTLAIVVSNITMEYWGEIFLFIAMVILFSALMALLGTGILAIATYLLPGIGMIIGWFAIIAVLVGVLLFTASLLLLLGMIKIDMDQVRENVECIMDTVMMIIDILFGSEDETEESQPKGFIGTILKCLGSGLGMMVKALMAVGFLALMVVAVLMVLFIAAQLRLLQELVLDPKQIKVNVGIVMETVQYIIDSIFGKKEETKTEASENDFFGTLIGYVQSGLTKIVQALMSIGYLALMVVSIMMVLFIASQLRILQEIELDKKTIHENVKTVMETAQLVIDCVFGPADDLGDKPSSRGYFYDILEFYNPAMAKIFGAIMSIAFLALIVVAILLVNFIAIQLRILQEIDLKEDVINQNVEIVMGTAKSIINFIFGPTDDKNDDPTKKGYFFTILEFFCPALTKIFGAIMSIAFLALIVVAIVLINFIALELRILQEIDLHPDEIEKNVRAVLDTANMLIDFMFETPDDKEDNPSKKGFFVEILNFCCPTLTKIFGAIMSIAFLALTIVSVSLIILLAQQLQYLEKLNINTGSIEKNISNIMSCVRNIIDIIFQDDQTKTHPKNDGAIKRLLRWTLGDEFMDLVDALLVVGYLAIVETAIGSLRNMVNDLNAIMTFSPLPGIEEKVKEITSTARRVIYAVFGNTKNIDEIIEAVEDAEEYLEAISEVPDAIHNVIKDFEKIQGFSKEIEEKCLGVTKSLTNIIGDINNSPFLSEEKIDGLADVMEVIIDIVDDMSDIEISSDQVSAIQNAMNCMITMTKDLANVHKLLNAATFRNMCILLEEFVEFNDLVADKSKVLKDASSATEKIFNSYSGFLKMADECDLSKDKEATLKRVFQALAEFPAGLKKDNTDRASKLLKDYNSFLSRVNKLDLTKLQSTTNLFEQMTKFSESINGNFDALADTLNEKIAPLMEELKNLLNDVQEKVTIKANQPSTDMEAEKQSIYNGMRANGQTQNLSNNEVQERVDNKYQSNLQQRYGIDEITSKLSELIDLFQSGDARVKTA